MTAFANTTLGKLVASRGLPLTVLARRCGYSDTSTLRGAAVGHNGIGPSAVIPLAMELGFVLPEPITPANVRALYCFAAAALDPYVPIPPMAPGFLGLELVMSRRRTSLHVAERLVAAELRIIAGDMYTATQFTCLSRWAQRTPDELRAYVENCTEWNVAHQGILAARRNAIAMQGMMWRAWISDEHAARLAALVAWRQRNGMLNRPKRKSKEPATPVVEPAVPIAPAVKPVTAPTPAPSRAPVVAAPVAIPATAPAPVTARTRSVWTPDLDRPRPELVTVDPTVRGKGTGKVAPKPVPVVDPDDAPIVVDDALRAMILGGAA